MSSIGAPELIIILLVVLLLFGSTKLPKLARSLGEASQEFKRGSAEGAKAKANEAAKANEDRAADRAADKAAEAADASDRVEMSRAELDALLAEREAKARGEAPPRTS